ncbi:MAG: DUF4342 domain-containing protein [Clostridia bacterium]|nr:DUF4342 domain-containing protein [Clostridia bacterium]
MTQYEMAEKLSEKCNVTLEKARNTLEAGDWNMLTATHLLEQEQFRRMQELNEVASGCEGMAVQYAPEEEAADEIAPDAQAATTDEIASDAQAAESDEPARVESAKRRRSRKGLGRHIRKAVACGNRNRLVVRRGGETVLRLPLTVLVPLLLCAFWVCVPLLVIGLFAGCRYSFEGRELGRGDINSALDKAASAAEHMKKAVAEA